MAAALKKKPCLCANGHGFLFPRRMSLAYERKLE